MTSTKLFAVLLLMCAGCNSDVQTPIAIGQEVKVFVAFPHGGALSIKTRNFSRGEGGVIKFDGNVLDIGNGDFEDWTQITIVYGSGLAPDGHTEKWYSAGRKN